MDKKVYFHLSYETIFGDTEHFVNECPERANRADRNDAEVALAHSAIELWYHLTMASRGCRRQGPSAAHRNTPSRSDSINIPQTVAAAATGADCAGHP